MTLLMKKKTMEKKNKIPPLSKKETLYFKDLIPLSKNLSILKNLSAPIILLKNPLNNKKMLSLISTLCKIILIISHNII
jgi:hypothetical protein